MIPPTKSKPGGVKISGLKEGCTEDPEMELMEMELYEERDIMQMAMLKGHQYVSFVCFMFSQCLIVVFSISCLCRSLANSIRG